MSVEETINQQNENLAPADGDFIPLWNSVAGDTDKMSIATIKSAVRTNYDWYTELGRTTLGSANDTITISSFSGLKYLRFMIFLFNSGQINAFIRFNNDSSTNYAYRFDVNNGTVSTTTSATSAAINPNASSSRKFIVIDCVNLAAEEKIFYGVGNEHNANGAANLPARAEFTGKWANTSSLITRVDINNSGTGDFDIASEVVVLGHN